MVSNSCSEYQKNIIDIFYGEMDMNEVVRRHIESCAECRKYYQDLVQVKEKLDNIEHHTPVEYYNITKAFDRANLVEKRRNLLSLLAFVVLGSIILGLVVALALRGYSKEIIYFQASMYFVVPFLLPMIIKVRSVKEGYSE